MRDSLITAKVVEDNLHNFNNHVSNFTRYLCEVTGQDYSENERKFVSRTLKALKGTDHIGLQEECESAGINMEDVSTFWYKGQHYSIKSNIKRDEVDLVAIQDSIISKMSSHSPNYTTFKRTEIDDPHLLVLDPADCHLGKLASKRETGDAYNLDIAINRVLDGCDSILNKASKFNIEKVKFLIGNDILHYDNAQKTTTSGTRQDTDVMFTDMFEAALETYVKVIDSLIQHYDVDIVFNSSNHDYLSGWMLAKSIESWYRLSDNVTVDSAITHRKYYQYGNNMIASTHGDGCKMDLLPLLMAQESPSMWATTKYRYAYLHHIHHKTHYKFLSGKDFVGVTVEYLRSPSSSDSWHHRNGYTGNKKAIEGFVHSKEYGQVARLTHYF